MRLWKKNLKVALECKNVRSENIAEILNDFTDCYKIWLHNSAFYAFFSLRSLWRLKELSKRLEKIKGIQFSYIKIQKR
jgi:hypothetical protein